jgi:site-specific recombinase XerD
MFGDMKDVCLEYVPKAIRLLADNSRRGINTVLKQWTAHLKGKLLSEATANDIVDFLDELRAKGLSDNTIRNRAFHLTTLYEKFFDAGIIERNNIRAVKHLFPLRQCHLVRETRMLSIDDVCRVINGPSRKSFKGIQDRAMLSLLFGAGLRRSEVAALNLEDIKIEKKIEIRDGRRIRKHLGYVLIKRAKAGKVQKQSFGPWVLARVALLLSKRRGDGADEGDPLFVTSYGGGRRMDGRTIARRFQKWCVLGGIEGWIAPHSARATAASTLKEMGYDDREVAHFLRHATQDMVKVYDRRAKELSDNPGLELPFR